jgi:CRP-like cAMP-binding protein
VKQDDKTVTRKAAAKRLPVVLDHIARNAILAGLTPSQATLVMERGGVVQLENRDVVYRAEEPINEVFFPIDCVLSVVTQMRDGGSIEIGTIGREGVSAIPLLLGARTSAHESYCQVPGRAVAIASDAFRELNGNGERSGFRMHVDRFFQGYVTMLGQLAACNGMHNIYERTARWLLMTQDRVDGDEIKLTHEFLAMMLGARRSGVTLAAATLAQAGFIRYAHGHIVVLDRFGLEGAACECYSVLRQQFQGLLRTN